MTRQIESVCNEQAQALCVDVGWSEWFATDGGAKSRYVGSCLIAPVQRSGEVNIFNLAG